MRQTLLLYTDLLVGYLVTALVGAVAILFLLPTEEYQPFLVYMLMFMWVMACDIFFTVRSRRRVQGLNKAMKNYDVKAVVQVGMSGPTADADESCRQKNGLDSSMPVFTVQGGFHMKRLPFPMQLIMKKINAGIAEHLKSKGELNAAEQATLVMASGGEGEPATWNGIQPAIDWALEQRNPLDVMKWHEPC